VKNSKKQQKSDGRGVEKRLELVPCACGCGYEQLLDKRHGQKCIKGHGGKRLMERRKERLKSVLALVLLGRGATWHEAQAAARALVEKALKQAQQLVADCWDYLGMAWRTS
jgi:hypothetical protein